jgi:hypothetical protein
VRRPDSLPQAFVLQRIAGALADEGDLKASRAQFQQALDLFGKHAPTARATAFAAAEMSILAWRQRDFPAVKSLLERSAGILKQREPGSAHLPVLERAAAAAGEGRDSLSEEAAALRTALSAWGDTLERGGAWR